MAKNATNIFGPCRICAAAAGGVYSIDSRIKKYDNITLLGFRESVSAHCPRQRERRHRVVRGGLREACLVLPALSARVGRRLAFLDRFARAARSSGVHLFSPIKRGCD
jgi:hypothetical protein